jgi:hypothetical protein
MCLALAKIHTLDHELQGMTVMGEPVEESAEQAFVLKNLGSVATFNVQGLYFGFI